MTSLAEVFAATAAATPEKLEAVLRLLREETPKPEPYLTLKGLGGKLGFGTTTLRRWQIPGHAIGNARRYRLTEVQEYFKTDAFNRRVAALRSERSREVNAKGKGVS